MVDVRVADGVEAQAWIESFTERVRSWSRRFDRSPEWLELEITRQTRLQPSATAHTFVIADGPSDIGYLSIRIAPDGSATSATIKDLWVHPDHRRRGIGTAVRDWAERWAAERATSLFVAIDPSDPATAALFASYPIRAQRMMKRLSAPAPLPDGVEGRPMTDDEYASWLDASIRGYAEQISDSGLSTWEDALARATSQTEGLLPQGPRTPGHSFWTRPRRRCVGRHELAASRVRDRHELRLRRRDARTVSRQGIRSGRDDRRRSGRSRRR